MPVLELVTLLAAAVRTAAHGIARELRAVGIDRPPSVAGTPALRTLGG